MQIYKAFWASFQNIRLIKFDNLIMGLSLIIKDYEDKNY